MRTCTRQSPTGVSLHEWMCDLQDASNPPVTCVAVTGAAGFVGTNLVRHLLTTGVEVRTFGRSPLRDSAAGDAVHTLGDIRDVTALERLCDGADIVFHLAAKITLFVKDPEAWDTNVRGPATVARAAHSQGVRRLVHCSSVHAFDMSQSRDHLDEQSPRSIAEHLPVYDRSKAAGEAEIRKVVDDGLDAVIVNPTGIYGPIEVGSSRVNRNLRLAARGRMPGLVGGGFDFVDVRDVVAGIVSAAQVGRTGESYLLTGHRVSAFDIARRAAAVNGYRGPRFALPLRLAQWLAPAGEAVGRIFGSDTFTRASVSTIALDPHVDGSKAARELGYEPRSVDETIKDLVASFG